MERQVALGGGDDAGFTLAEIVVSMLLFSLLAMAFFPVVLRTSEAAAAGTTLSTASRLVSKHMERVRAAPISTCPPTDPQPSGTVVESVTDGRGNELQVWAKFDGPCTASGLARYVVTVTKSSAPGVPLASATTLIMLEPLP